MAKIAIIETGGKQYVVSNDSVVTIEKLPFPKGEKVTFDKIVLVDDGATVSVGAPYVAGASVGAEVIDEGREKKVTVIKYQAKSRRFKKKGHRQAYTKVRITKLP